MTLSETDLSRAGRWARAGVHVGALCLLLIACGHTAAHLLGQGKPTSPEQAELLRLMQSADLNQGNAGDQGEGARRGVTMMGLLNGFSWFFVLGNAAAALLLWAQARTRVRHAAGAGAVFSVLGAAIAAAYFPLAPAVLYGAAAIAFFAALVLSGISV